MVGIGCVGLGCCWLIGAEWRTPSYPLLADEPLRESAPPQQATKVTLSQLAGLWDSLPSRIARQQGLLVMLQCKRRSRTNVPGQSATSMGRLISRQDRSFGLSPQRGAPVNQRMLTHCVPLQNGEFNTKPRATRSHMASIPRFTFYLPNPQAEMRFLHLS